MQLPLPYLTVSHLHEMCLIHHRGRRGIKVKTFFPATNLFDIIITVYSSITIFAEQKSSMIILISPNWTSYNSKWKLIFSATVVQFYFGGVAIQLYKLSESISVVTMSDAARASAWPHKYNSNAEMEFDGNTKVAQSL